MRGGGIFQGSGGLGPGRRARPRRLVRGSLRMVSRVVFIFLLLVGASGCVSPPVALAMGLVFGLAFPHPYSRAAKKLSRFLLQASVVGLGFGMNLHEVVRVGRSGFIYTMLGISLTLLA